jgi:hypothetical protein
MHANRQVATEMQSWYQIEIEGDREAPIFSPGLLPVKTLRAAGVFWICAKESRMQGLE